MSDITTRQGVELTHTQADAAHSMVGTGVLAPTVVSNDEQLFASFASELRANGVHDVRVLSAAREWYKGFADEMDKQQEKQDDKDIRSCLQRLRQMWGGDHVANMRLLNELMDEIPEAVALPLYEGRCGDGVRLLNNPALVNFMVAAKRAMDAPPVDWKRTSTDATELEEIKRLMGDSRSDYWRGPRAAKLQARYLELVGGGT